MLRSLAAVLLCSCALLSACGDDSGAAPTAVEPDDEVVLGDGDGCGDAFFWATNADDTIAVTVFVDERARSSQAPTTVSFDVGDAGLTAQVLRGEELSATFCTDLLVGDPIDSETDATAGHVEITLDPQALDGATCGDFGGTATITGLEGDGLSFADVTVETENIGCYAG
jgi:hypothetical protein